MAVETKAKKCRVCCGLATHPNPCDLSLARPGRRLGVVNAKIVKKIKQAKRDARVGLTIEERSNTIEVLRSVDVYYRRESDQGRERVRKRRYRV